jgi:hypothetical protein
MGKKEKLKNNFETSISNVIKLNKIISIFLTSLQSILKQAKSEKAPNTLIQSMNNQINLYKGIHKDYKTPEIFPTVYEQQLILMVSILENFLKRFFVLYLKFNYKKIDADKFDHISFKLKDILEPKTSKENIGFLLIEKDNKINFQNYTSIVENYEKIGLNFKKILNKKEVESFKYLLQCRHLLVHENGIVNKYFVEITGKRRVGEKISISLEMIDGFKDLSSKIVNSLMQKLNNGKTKSKAED